MKRNTLTLLALACALVVAPIATAQTPMAGEDNEFGSLRMAYSVDMDGERVPISAEVVIEDYYHEKDGRFYMFGFDVKRTPLDVTLDQVIRTDTGQDVPCFKSEGDANSEVKCFVDGTKLPPNGTKIMLHGSVGSSKAGTFNVGALIVAFTATWVKIQMSNGLDAELYATTQVNVHSITQESTGGPFNPADIPAAGAVGAVAAVGVAAVGVAALRSRQRR